MPAHCADLLADLLDGAVDDGVDIRFEKVLEVLTPDGLQRTQAGRPVLLDIAEQLQQALLPQERPLVLLQQRHGLLLKHPAQEVVYVGKW